MINVKKAFELGTFMAEIDQRAKQLRAENRASPNVVDTVETAPGEFTAATTAPLRAVHQLTQMQRLYSETLASVAARRPQQPQREPVRRLERRGSR